MSRSLTAPSARSRWLSVRACVAKELLSSGLAYLDQKPLAELDARDKRLMSLLLSLAHVSLAVEVQADQEPNHAEFARHMKITRAAADS
jgi:hypothetical protein